MKLLLFIFRKVASENPKVATPIDGLECRLQFKSPNPKPYSRGLPRLSPGDMAIESEMTMTLCVKTVSLSMPTVSDRQGWSWLRRRVLLTSAMR